jgi:hypothetical protein
LSSEYNITRFVLPDAMRRLVLFAMVISATACGPRPLRPTLSPGGAVGVQSGIRLGSGSKRVVTKDPPSTLVAEDGTVCRVAPDRYADTKVGQTINCEWQLGNPVPAKKD